MSDCAGLYDGFEGFKNPTEEDIAQAARTALVVLDANVLLKLYSFQGRALDDFLRVFEALGERLFVPHQAMDEFWRNRTTVLQQNAGRHLEEQKIREAFEVIDKEFAGWFKRVVDAGGKPPAEARQAVAEASRQVLTFIEESNAHAQAVTVKTPTYEDPVLSRLEGLLRGRVGAAPTPSELAELDRDGDRRIKDRVPPGYLDGDKANGRGTGDYKVWRAAMEESARRQLPVLMVTDDQKDDWVVKATGLPRPELTRELRQLSGQALLMIRSHDLVGLGPALGVDVSEQTIAQADAQAHGGMPETAEDGDWTEELAYEYLEWLYEGWPDHYDVLVRAVREGGQIGRDQMAEMLDRDATVNMRGVGQPFSTALRRLVKDRDLVERPPLPFYPVYEAGWMTRFSVHEPLLPLLERAITEYELLDSDQDSMGG